MSPQDIFQQSARTMNNRSGYDTAGAFLNAHIGNTGAPWASTGDGPFVTISRESGSSGNSFAEALAQRLNTISPGEQPWTVYTGNLIEQLLQSQQLSPRLARYLPEDKVSEISASIGELVGLHPNIWELVQKTSELIRSLARAGRAIFVGRGANFATASVDGGVHLRLVAPTSLRAREIAKREHLDEPAAVTFNAKCDQARARYVRTYFNADINDATAYHLVINLSKVSLPETLDMVSTLVTARAPAPPAI
jgi:cytidylate kinase